MENPKYPGPQNNFTVFVRTITFNQAKYITDNLNGVAMQQTDFPFVHFVIDDASTDGEQEVILDWLGVHCDMHQAEIFDLPLSKVILASHKSNKNCSYAIYLLKKNLYKDPEKNRMYQTWRDRCKYEALCEGDDYWTDPKKLQKQVDFLDTNPEYSFCGHRFKFLCQQTQTFEVNPSPDHSLCNQTITLNQYVTTLPWAFQPLTLMMRQGFLSELNKYENSKDVALIYVLLKKGNGWILDSISGVYRLNNESTFYGLSHEAKVIANIKTALGIYAVEKDIYSANLLKKHMVDLRKHFGKKFFLRNMRLLFRCRMILLKYHL